MYSLIYDFVFVLLCKFINGTYFLAAHQTTTHIMEVCTALADNRN